MRKNLGSRSRPEDVLAQHAPYDLGRSDALVEMRLHEATERPAEEEIHLSIKYNHRFMLLEYITK